MNTSNYGEADGLIKTHDEHLLKQIAVATKTGSNLVRLASELPMIGGTHETLRSFTSFTEFMNKQEERINELMRKMANSIGCPMRVPAIGTSMSEYTRCFIEGQDNIAERASSLVVALKKSHRDEVVKVPEFILKAAPTNERTQKTVENKIKTFSANIGDALANEFRKRKEEMALMIVHDKPQKKYNIIVDNSPEPFKSKLKTKHHKRNCKKGIQIVEEGDSGEFVEWPSLDTETEEENPYTAEILNLNVNDKYMKSNEPIKYKPLEESTLTMIDTLEKLESLRDVLNNVDLFAVDLEHNDKRSYLGLTCLMQISTREEDYIIDPFPIWEHIGLLNEPFTNPKILKVFHGCDSDVMWLQRDFGIYLVNIFDTYVAMKKLAFPKFSLAHLIGHYTSVALDKMYQLADWRVRPLVRGMVNYAREDTHYLLFCYDNLREELIKNNQFEQVREECKNLCLKVYKKPIFNPKGFLTEIKFRFTLNNRQEYAMAQLYKWRDNVARKEDESPQYVLPNHMLLTIAETLPRDVGGIYACCNPLPTYVKQRTGEIFKIIVDSRTLKLEKKTATAKEVDDAHEARGVVNQKMDQLYAMLKCQLDFSHCQYDEEKGEIKVDKSKDSQDVIRIKDCETLLNVLTGNIKDRNNIFVVNEEQKMMVDSCKRVIKNMEVWATPFECYTISVKEKNERAKEELKTVDDIKQIEKRKLVDEKKFSHNDPTVCRKPVFEENVDNVDELKLLAAEDDRKSNSVEKFPTCDRKYDETQILSKKCLKRKIKHAKKSVDIPTNSSLPPKKSREVQEFDYEQQDITLFDNKLVDKKEFDPFAQKMKNQKPNKKKIFRKSANRQGTINYANK